MNSSQNRDLAIIFLSKIIRLKEGSYMQRRSLFFIILVLLLTLQGCSAIESIFDGSAFSDSMSPPATESSSKDSAAEVVSTEEKGPEIIDLNDSKESSIKPLTQTKRTAPTEQDKIDVAAPKSIEVMWQVPTEPVVAYHIYLQSGALDQVDEKKHFRVLVSKLKKEDNATYGPVYKYQVPGNLIANTILIRAENRFGLSEPSEPMIVQK